MQIVTANRLIDGRVVFRDAAGGWVETFAAAVVLAPEAAREAVAAASADVAARRVVEPYAVDVVVEAGAVTPKAMREKIRVSGPTSGSEEAARAGLARRAA